MLKLTHVSHSFSGKEKNSSIIHILKDINLEVLEGDTVAIIGKSGSGKSTLLNLIAGLDDAIKGEIIFLNQVYRNLSVEEKNNLRKLHMGIVFQTSQLISTLTAWENVLIPLELRNFANSMELALSALKLVHMEDRLYHYPHQLSGGEAQRVSLARAMASSPKLVLADEPNANLDQVTGNQVMSDLFLLVKKLKSSLILVTHDMDLAAQCDQVYELNDGVLQRVNE